MSYLSKQKGFTLIELLIVIAIIGILASVLMVNFIGVRQRARDTQRKSDLRQIQTALELYRSDQDAYPASISCGGQIAEATTVYMQKVPCDPLGPIQNSYNAGAYYYEQTSAYTYTLVACLENASDSQKSTDTPPSGASGTCSSNSYYILYNP